MKKTNLYSSQNCIMENSDKLLQVAQKYVWWKTPQEALSDQNHFIAQVMTIGTIEDCFWLLDFLGEPAFIKAIKNPPIGVFNGRSWAYWHYKLGIIKPEDTLPSLPKRK